VRKRERRGIEIEVGREMKYILIQRVIERRER